MKVPLSWLREYVDVDLPPAELAHRLTMSGVEVGEVEIIGGWDECFVGEVLSVKPHPQADRLQLCQVDTGDGEQEVVCGAPNVAAKQKICYARVGAELFNAHAGKREVLKPARIRGVVSNGMICSELELGLGDDHAGILVLPEDAPVGTPLDRYLGDTVLDLELTPNRLDCLSITGVAHEVAALTGKLMRMPDIQYPEEGAPIAGQVSISVADPDLCHRYTASLIHEVKIGPSPQWLQDRLTRAGLRPINNVVDATNYVMLEFNQPLHAFDFDRLKDHTVIVRRARPGEKLVTLDGEERKLDEETLVIADANDPIGLGGVIGGANSEIDSNTTSVLLEAATFQGHNNRRTAQLFHLRTEATLRFEKGLSPELAPIALRRATQLIQQTTGGKVAPGIIDVFPADGGDPPVVVLTMARLKKLLGMDLDLDRVTQVLESLGFDCKRLDGEAIEASVPYWRNDINIEDDLVEEVVRIIGYDVVPTTMLSTPIPSQAPDRKRLLLDSVRDILAASGMQEVISYPLVSLGDLEKTRVGESANQPLRLANPMSEGQEYLRPTLRASLLNTLVANQGHTDEPLQLFEVGRVFLPRTGDLPDEQETVAGVMTGRRWRHSWLAGDDLVDFFDAKGMVESLLSRLEVDAQYQSADDPLFQPGRCAAITAGKVELGILGELHPVVRERFDLRPEPVVFFELRVDALLEAMPNTQRHFATLARYPAATRDLALVVPSDVPAGRVQELIARHRMVERVELFDMYSGDNVDEGTKSLAFHVSFQSRDRTLTSEEVSRSLQGLLRNLEKEVQATLRS